MRPLIPRRIGCAGSMVRRAYNQAHKFEVETTISSEVVGFDTQANSRRQRTVQPSGIRIGADEHEQVPSLCGSTEERMRSHYGFLRDLGLSEPRLICSHFS